MSRILFATMSAMAAARSGWTGRGPIGTRFTSAA